MPDPSGEFAQFVLEQLDAIPDLSAGRFFGGSGIKSRSTLFAMIMGNALYFAVDDATRADYERLGSRCFSYGTKKGPVEVRRFLEVPGEVLEDRERLVTFAQGAIAAALKAASSPKRRHRKAAA